MISIDILEKELNQLSWCVAIFASREDPIVLLETINSVLNSADELVIVDVLVNGNHELAEAIAKLVCRYVNEPKMARTRVWSLELGDKASTWNQYLHNVWPGHGVVFFVDGYCRLSPNAFQLLAEGLANASDALAGSSVPTVGRTATKWREELLREGGLVGGCFAFKESVMKELRVRGFRLPLGLYGYDALLGAVIAFGLDPSKNSWKLKERIFVHPEVTWITDDKKWWRLSDVKTQFDRTIKVALRLLVSKSVQNFFQIRKMLPEHLPRTTSELVLSWVKDNPVEARKTMLKNPLCYLALKKLRYPRDWSAADRAPTLIYASR